MKSFSSGSLVCGAFAALAALSSVAPAATTINIDFNRVPSGSGTYTGTAAAPIAGDTGTTWNGVGIGAGPLVPTFTSVPLVTSTGIATAVTVSLGNFQSYDATENPAAPSYAALMTDFAYQQTLGPGGPNSTFSVNNLNPALTYDVYFYAQNGGYQNTATIFTIGATSQTATNAGSVPPNPQTTTFIQGTNYVLFTNVAPNGAGTISGTFNDVAAANNAAFNGIQIVQVPEPAALALAGMAGLLVLRRRRS